MIVTQGYGGRSIVTNGYGRQDSLYAIEIAVPAPADYSTYTEGVPANTFYMDSIPGITGFSEGVPAILLSLEGIPGDGVSLDGAWTEIDQDGAWTEPPVNGAYTQDNSYLDEVKPMTFFTKESVPGTPATVTTDDTETLPAGRGAYTTVGESGAKTTIGERGARTSY